ncbi:MAG: TIGR03067 domain-containing protein [Candidatus Solibacter sp.]
MAGDLESLQGRWKIVSLEMEGQTMGGGDAQIEVRGARFTTRAMGAEYAGTLTVDEGQTPRRFDLRFDEGPEKGTTALGIYELRGDVWKLCLTTRGGERPKEFAAPAGTGIAFEVLQRVGGEVAVAEGAVAEGAVAESGAGQGDGAPELAGEWSAVALVRDGDALPPSMLSYGKRTATANEVTVKFGPQVMVKARYGVDRTRTPMTMDYHLAKGGRQQGIWKLEGGELTTCFGKPGAGRPVDFASEKGEGCTLAVWKQKS